MKKIIYPGVFLVLVACAGNQLNQTPPPPQALPVIKLNTGSATIWQEYPASLEGTVNVEIRSQVNGYLEKIYVEEGAYVLQGQPLFSINSSEYKEYANNAGASIQLAKANMERAQVEVDRIKPLVDNKVVADVQLKTALANLAASKAALAQAVSSKGSADITVGYTLIKAPVNGYIGHIPFKKGTVVSKTDIIPLTVLSEVNNVHAYFSMSESDFLTFLSKVEGKTTEEKVKNILPVELQLPDNTTYKTKGRVELVQGQFDRNAGAISFRAVFNNADKQLRSGMTGKIRIPSMLHEQIIVPQEATYEVQDKIFVFALGDSNKVASKQIFVSGKSGSNYLVNKGLVSGETILFSGLQRVRDGIFIAPQPISLDSVLRASL
ncbi:MAG: efflux RND transporter periplasmic adaptor subunit [Chitinophagaceae bacterium]|nr:MAG: efflux RND transporter periplasmic adaptor subunit [Chitinophagaceae bacterium]